MQTLADVDRGRDNNFNLIRFVAALAVLVSHAWPIALGPGAVQPLEALSGHTLGALAVYLFFAVSGYFIAASFARSRSAGIFLAARALRLFPCLVVSLLLVALVMGPLVTALPVGAYLADPGTLAFVLRNIALIAPQYTLPGVFADQPYPMVEGSIWTLVHEVACYALVFVAGITGLLFRRRAMSVALLAYGALWILPAALPTLADLPVPGKLAQTRELSLPFAAGIAFWLWRDRLVLSGWVAIGLLALSALLRGTDLQFGAMILALSYGTFWLAYVPDGAIRGFNRLGDYSYGLYVYAFPLQGLAVWLWGAAVGGAMGPWANVALAAPMTLACAVASWHWVERPALALVPKPGRKPQVAPDPRPAPGLPPVQTPVQTPARASVRAPAPAPARARPAYASGPYAG